MTCPIANGSIQQGDSNVWCGKGRYKPGDRQLQEENKQNLEALTIYEM